GVELLDGGHAASAFSEGLSIGAPVVPVGAEGPDPRHHDPPDRLVAHRTLLAGSGRRGGRNRPAPAPVTPGFGFRRSVESPIMTANRRLREAATTGIKSPELKDRGADDQRGIALSV